MSSGDRPYSLPGNNHGSSEVAGRREAGSKCPYCPSPITIGAVIHVCHQCRSVHHNACWKKHGRCGAYECATARHFAPPGSESVEPYVPPVASSVMVITTGELARAEPLPAARLPMASGRPLVRPNRSGPVFNRLAITAFVTAIAGIPFFGVLTGLAAIALATFALVRINARGERGKRLAIAGLSLGVIDVVGWIIFLAWSLSGTSLQDLFHDRARRHREAGHVKIASDGPRPFVTISNAAEDH